MRKRVDSCIFQISLFLSFWLSTQGCKKEMYSSRMLLIFHFFAGRLDGKLQKVRNHDINPVNVSLGPKSRLQPIYHDINSFLLKIMLLVFQSISRTDALSSGKKSCSSIDCKRLKNKTKMNTTKITRNPEFIILRSTAFGYCLFPFGSTFRIFSFHLHVKRRHFLRPVNFHLL